MPRRFEAEADRPPLARDLSEEVHVFRCVLVPLDGTPFGEQAIPHAVAVARHSGAPLHLVHVHLPPIIPSGAETAALPPVWIEMSREDKQHYLDGLASALTASGVEVETRVLEGGVVPAVEQYARRCGAALIAMSTHGHVGFSRLWHHGVAEQLARELPLPVLLVRARHGHLDLADRADPTFSHLLVPLDGSPDSELILEHAVELGRPFGARYTLLRVVTSAGAHAGMTGAEVAEVEEWEHASEIAARQYLNALAERLRSRALDVDVAVVVGDDAATAILDHVNDWRVQPDRRIDLIALESPDRGTMTRLFFRDTADQLIRDSPVPILHFRAPRQAPRSLLTEAGPAVSN